MQTPFKYLAILVVVCVLNAVGQLMMRRGGTESARVELSLESLPEWAAASRLWIAGLALTWSCGLVWAWSLRHVPLTTGLPLYNGLVYCLTILGGIFVLGERLTPLQATGVALVFGGLLLIFAPTSTAAGH